MNCSVPELHFATRFCGSWPQNRSIASGPILVPEGRLSLWLILLPDWKLEWHVPVQTPRASLSLVAPLPVHALDKLKLYETGSYRCWFSKWGDCLWSGWNGHPEHQQIRSEVRFRNLSRSHGVPSSGFRMHVLAVERFPWTWRFGTLGKDNMQYDFKGSAFAHPTSTILSASRVSSLMFHSAGV